MKSRSDLKIYTLRHFLFYMGVVCIVSTVILAASEILDWGYGLSVALLIVAGLIVPTVALRESLFVSARRPDEQRHRRHA